MTINEQVARFLESPAVRRINFQCGPTRVWGGGYERIAAGIRRRVSERHRIIVEANTVLQAVGCGNYNHSLGPNRVNKMMLPILSMRSVQDRAITLHEATHALQDWCANPMMQADSEAAAYIAQMMYVHIETGRFPYELEPGFNGDVLDLFIRCYNVGVRILSTRGGYVVTAEEQRTIKDMLQRIPLYRASATRMIRYNGI